MNPSRLADGAVSRTQQCPGIRIRGPRIRLQRAGEKVVEARVVVEVLPFGLRHVDLVDAGKRVNEGPFDP